MAKSILSRCDEVHTLNTIDGEAVLIGTLVFSASGQKAVIPNLSRAQVFEISFQPTVAGGYQLFEGQIPVSGHWQLSASQFWTWGGKVVADGINLTADQACTVQFEARYRVY
jgi:hypothetical protein